MAEGNPTPDQGMSRLRVEATLPNSGQRLVMTELTGKDELNAAMDAGDIETVRGRMVHVWAQAMRALVSIEGEPFDSSLHTPESFRELFSAKDFGFVVELFMLANRPKEAEVATFRAGAETAL